MNLLRFWFPLLGYSAIIFFLSSLPATKVVSVPLWDKFLHVLEYAPLGFLWARALLSLKKLDTRAVWVLALVFSYSYGLSDEFHQAFTPGREAGLGDAVADFIGGALGAGIYLIIQQRFNKKKEVVHHVSA